VDYQNVNLNTFTVANQWTTTENSDLPDKTSKRPDVIVFLNGLPLVVFELKSPSRKETDASEAYRQLRNYLHEIPSLFIYNAFLVMSDHAMSRDYCHVDRSQRS
jgi:type I restriction enzyme R subunit